MGVVIKISKKDTIQTTRKALKDFIQKRSKKSGKKLSDFYGKMPGLYEDGLAYQKKMRDDWD